MKKFTLSVCAVVAMSGLGFAGGDISPIEPVVVVPVVEEADDSGLYVGLGLVYHRTFDQDSGWFDDSVASQDETGGFTGIIGYNFNKYIAVEGRISKSFFEEDYADVFTYSIYLKPQIPLTEEFKVYGLLGFGGAQVEATDGNTPAYDPKGTEIMDETSFQWGIGVSYTFMDDETYDRKDTWTIFVDYTSLADDADIHAPLYQYEGGQIHDKLNNDALTVGVIYNF